MKKFMDENFQLQNDTAQEIYTGIKDLPIIDYHNHLDPGAIANNKQFANITELWLGNDHYKWRLMRAHGIAESHITGDAPDEEKFAAWCETLEIAIGSPIYHWAHMELKQYFGYDKPVTAANANEIYEHCNNLMESEDFSVHALLKKSRIEWLATTDDPTDTLKHHAKIAFDKVQGLPKILPTFRPCVLFDPRDVAFEKYIKNLELVANMRDPITDWESLLIALEHRLDFFAMRGCVSADHIFDPPVYDTATNDTKATLAFRKALRGESLSVEEVTSYKTRLFAWLGGQYAKRKWVMQLHIGAMRSNNSKMFNALGANSGFDSMADTPFAQTLARMLDDLERHDALPKTILYALNPAANETLATMIATFQGNGVRTKMQWGAPWWFNNNKTGIQKHLVTLAEQGMLAHFAGMLTDARCFISLPRHDYFRRILANQLGTWAENGEFPRDMVLLNKIASDIAYNNTKNYFK